MSRNGSKKALGIRMLRIGKNALRDPGFDDHTMLHDGNSVADLCCDTQIMCNEHHRKPKLRPKVLHEVQNLGLHGNIKGRNRFIRH